MKTRWWCRRRRKGGASRRRDRRSMQTVHPSARSRNHGIASPRSSYSDHQSLWRLLTEGTHLSHIFPSAAYACACVSVQVSDLVEILLTWLIIIRTARSREIIMPNEHVDMEQSGLLLNWRRFCNYKILLTYPNYVLYSADWFQIP